MSKLKTLLDLRKAFPTMGSKLIFTNSNKVNEWLSPDTYKKVNSMIEESPLMKILHEKGKLAFSFTYEDRLGIPKAIMNNERMYSEKYNKPSKFSDADYKANEAFYSDSRLVDEIFIEGLGNLKGALENSKAAELLLSSNASTFAGLGVSLHLQLFPQIDYLEGKVIRNDEYDHNNKSISISVTQPPAGMPPVNTGIADRIAHESGHAIDYGNDASMYISKVVERMVQNMGLEQIKDFDLKSAIDIAARTLHPDFADQYSVIKGGKISNDASEFAAFFSEYVFAQLNKKGSIEAFESDFANDFSKRISAIAKEKSAGDISLFYEAFTYKLLKASSSVISDRHLSAVVNSSFVKLEGELKQKLEEFTQNKDPETAKDYNESFDRMMQDETERSINKLKDDILKDKNIKGKIDSIIKDNVNERFDDTVQSISDIDLQHVEAIKTGVISKSEESIRGYIINLAMSIAKNYDTSNSTIKAAADVTFTELNSYITITTKKYIGDAASLFTQDNISELQKNLANLDAQTKDTRQELEATQAQLKELTDNPDHTLSPEEIQQRKSDLNKEIQNKTKELEDAQEMHDTIDPSQKGQDKREQEYKDAEVKTWPQDYEINTIAIDSMPKPELLMTSNIIPINDLFSGDISNNLLGASNLTSDDQHNV